jgi:hypothetical protein
VLVLEDGGNIETISVQMWADSLYGWSVVRHKDQPAGELVGFAIGADGIPSRDQEPVAWQAPELRFGNLPKNAIPIVDARAESDPSDARHVRLYVTYRDNLGKTAITSADNFPVAGERSPTIFARQVKALVTQGSDLSAPQRSVLFISSLGLVGLTLLVLGLLPSRTRDHDFAQAPDPGMNEQTEEEPELRNGAGKPV